MQSIFKRISLFLVFTGIVSISTGQEYIGSFEQFTVEDGLSNRFVNAVIQDRDGFLWIATNYGLNRYDGNEFQLYTSQNMDWQSDVIWRLMEDKNRYLWVSTKKRAGANSNLVDNVHLIHLPTGAGLQWEEVYQNAPFQSSDIYDFKIREEYIYISTQNGQLFRWKDGIFELIYQDPKNHIVDFALASKDRIFLILYNRNDNTDRLLREIDHNGEVICEKKAGFSSKLFAVEDGEVWISNLPRNEKSKPSDFLYVIKNCHPEPVYLESLGLPSTYKISEEEGQYAQSFLIREEQSDAYWFLQPNKLVLFSTSEGLKYDFSHFLEPGTNLAGKASIIPRSKRSGWMAFAGSAQGFYQYSFKKNYFKKVVPTASRQILEDAFGNIYIQTQDGFAFQQHDQDSLSYNYPFISLSVPLLKDHQGNIWNQEAQSGQFFRFKPQSEQIDTFYADPSQYWSPGLWSMFQSVYKKDIFFLGSDQGLYFTNLFSPEPAVLPFADTSENSGQLIESRILAFLETGPDSLWLSTSSGIYLVNLEEGVQAWYNKEQKENYLPLSYVNHIHRDRQGLFWIATRGDGLVKWDSKKGTYQSFKVDQGLSHNVIYAIYEDANDGLWMSSDRGIMRFNKKTGQVRTFLESDGLVHEEFNTASHYQGKDGRIWFGGLGGVIVFEPNEILKDTLSENFPFKVTDFQKYDASEGNIVDQLVPTLQTNRVVLEPGDKFFQIKFALLEFNPSANQIFRWKIENWDEEWNFQNENIIRVNGLPPGQYTLYVQAQSSNGQWSKDEIKLEILVKKAFYQQSWFFLFILSIISGVIIWRFKAIRNTQEALERQVAERTDQIKKDAQLIESQAEKLKELDKLKSRFFANASHELRTPLTLILAPLSRLLQSNPLSTELKEQLSLMQRNGKKLLKLVEEILDLSKIDANKLVLKEEATHLKSFLGTVSAIFESQAQIQQVNFKFDYTFHPELVVELDKIKVERILINLLSNAFKHTPAEGNIQLSAQSTDSLIKIIVTDTGKGIAPDDLPHIFDRFYQTKRTDVSLEGGIGIGLSLSKEYAKMMNGSLTAESQLGGGSTFTLVFPKKEAHHITSQRVMGTLMATKIAQPVKLVPMGQASKARILLVEDNTDMQQFIKVVLDDFGQVHTAANGKIALEYLNSSQELPDLIVSDVMMPEMDGFSMLEKIRENNSWNLIPIIMLTARAEKTDRMQALLLGVDDYLTKPFDVEELQARIKNILQKIALKSQLLETSAHQPQLLSAAEKWLKELERKSSHALENGLLSVSGLASEMALSERQFRRKIQELTGMPPSEYLREVRLQKARELLEQNIKNTVSEVAYEVGFSKVDYFSQIFRERFGKTPSSYLSV